MVKTWKAVVCALAAVWLGGLAVNRTPVQAQSAPASAPSASVTAQRAVFTQYCASCHNERMKKAGTVPVALDDPSLWDIAAHAPTW